MTGLGHSIGTATLTVDADTEEIALALLPRLEGVHHRRVVPALEQVLDEAAGTGPHITLGRLEIDLGRVPMARFDEELGERLRRELRRLLADMLPSSRERGRPEGASWLALLEHCLLHGTLPYWAPDEAPFSLEALLLSRLDEDPDGVVRLLRTHRRRSPVLERLVRQLDAAGLARLLRELDPENAALIIAYLLDLRELHHAEPLVALSEESFGRVLWILTLHYELSDPGSQFNRRSFVRSLLEDLSVSEDVPLDDLLAALRIGLHETRKRHPLRSSLPAVIDEVLADMDRRADATAASMPEPAVGASGRGTLALFEHRLLYGNLPAWAPAEMETTLEGLLRRALELDPRQVAVLVRRHAAGPRVLGHLVDEVGEEGRRRLLRAILPGSGAPLIEILEDLLEIGRTEPFVDPGREILARRVWLLTLRWAVDHHSSQVDRTRFVRSLLVGMAEAEAIAYRDLLGEMQAGVARAAGRRTFVSPLPALLRELSAELDRGETPAAEAWTWEPGPDGPTVPGDGGASVREAALAFLRGDTAPAMTVSKGALGTALRSMLDEQAPELVSLVARLARDERLHARWARLLPEAIVRRLLAMSDPGGVGAPEQGKASEQGESRSGDSARTEGSRGSAAAAIREMAMALLLGETPRPVGALPESALRDSLDALLEVPTPELAAALNRRAANEGVRARWSKHLPETALARVAAVLAPRNHRELLEAGRLVGSAWRAAAPTGASGLGDAAAFWSAFLAILARHSGTELTVEQLTQELFAHFALRSLGDISSHENAAGVGERVLAELERVAGNAGNSPLTAAIQRRRESLLASFSSARPSPDPRPQQARPASPARQVAPDRQAAPERHQARGEPLRGRTAFGLDETEPDDDLGGEAVFVDNAGLVLVSPFLPHLFGALELLARDDAGKVHIRDPDAASRAVHLLQNLVDGRTDAPEPTLVLAKVLAGVPTGAPVARAIEPTENERALCERLLKSVIASWPILSNTSIAGLRETFLRREGKLQRGDDRWMLRVQRKTVDVLVDQIPWSLSVLYHPWMSEPLYVTW